MPKIITLDKIRIENIQIFGQENEWYLVINYTMMNGGSDRMGATRTWELVGGRMQRTKNLVESFVDDLKAELDIEDVEGLPE
jgi:hypothetical protein